MLIQRIGICPNPSHIQSPHGKHLARYIGSTCRLLEPDALVDSTVLDCCRAQPGVLTFSICFSCSMPASLMPFSSRANSSKGAALLPALALTMLRATASAPKRLIWLQHKSNTCRKAVQYETPKHSTCAEHAATHNTCTCISFSCTCNSRDHAAHGQEQCAGSNHTC